MRDKTAVAECSTGHSSAISHFAHARSSSGCIGRRVCALARAWLVVVLLSVQVQNEPRIYGISLNLGSSTSRSLRFCPEIFKVFLWRWFPRTRITSEWANNCEKCTSCCCCTQTRGPIIMCIYRSIYRLFVRVIKGDCNTNKFCNQNKSIILFSPSFIIRLKPNGRNGIMSNSRFKLANSEDLWSADFTEPSRVDQQPFAVVVM